MAFITKNIGEIKLFWCIGGGSGHEPLFNGFAGKGLADAVACGDVFAAPNPFLISQTAKAVNQGKGVLICLWLLCR